jgi:hypothetical protein
MRAHRDGSPKFLINNVEDNESTDSHVSGKDCTIKTIGTLGCANNQDPISIENNDKASIQQLVNHILLLGQEKKQTGNKTALTPEANKNDETKSHTRDKIQNVHAGNNQETPSMPTIVEKAKEDAYYANRYLSKVLKTTDINTSHTKPVYDNRDKDSNTPKFSQNKVDKSTLPSKQTAANDVYESNNTCPNNSTWPKPSPISLQCQNTVEKEKSKATIIVYIATARDMVWNIVSNVGKWDVIAS